MSGGGKTGADKLEGAWEFYGHMDRRWKADPCAPVDYYDPDASLTFPEALRLCCYAADYERGGLGRYRTARGGTSGASWRRRARRPGRWTPCSNACEGRTRHE